jgi:hypothetical protein
MRNMYSFRQALHLKTGAIIFNISRISALMVLMLLLYAVNGLGQSVFFDDFNRVAVSPGGTPEMTYTSTNTGGGSSIIESSLATGTVPYLKIANGTPAGRSYITGPLTTFASPFSPTLSANTGPVTWAFNIRHNRGGGTTTTLSGFGSTSYGIAVVLVASNPDLLAAGCNGYAVVMGAPSGNVYNLVKFTNGLSAQANFTTVITGTLPTSTLPNNLRDYMSIKVTYDPLTNTWSLYERVDGLSAVPAWADPTTTTNLIGSNVDNTYTGIAMSAFGFFWNYSTSTGLNAFFDNFNVNVTPIVNPVLTAVPTTLSGFNYISGSGPSSPAQSYLLSGLNLTGAPGDIAVGCLTNYEVSTNNTNFYESVNVGYTSGTLSATPVYVRLKSGLAVGNYNSETVTNVGGGATLNVTCNGYVLSGQVTYTWTGATDNSWAEASNWSPQRTTPAINDILQFSNGNTYTVTNVPTQTIAQLSVSNGSKITLQSAATAILTIAGDAGVDLIVDGSGSELNISGTSVLTISLSTGSTGLVNSSMTISGAAHILKSTDASSLIFATGSVFKATTGFTGNAFGTTNLNSVKFQSGSTYIQDAGSNPFGAGAPASVLIFEPGSLYKFTAPSGGPSYSGRTYANFENASPLTTQNNQGSNPMTCDNYTVTSGIVNWDFSGGVVIKGNLTVSPGATLTFGMASKIMNLTLSGTTSQTIANTGTLTFGGNCTLIINNTSGISLNSDMSIFSLTFQNGKIATGANILSLAPIAVITGAGAGKYVYGNLRWNIPTGDGTRNFEIGDATSYTPVSISLTGVTLAGTLTGHTVAGDHPAIATSGINLNKSVNRYWSFTASDISGYTYDATLNFLSSDVDPGANTSAFIIKKHDGSAWSSTTTGILTPTSSQATGMTSFSDFQIGEPDCISPLVYNVNPVGSYCFGGTGLPVGLNLSETGVDYQLYIDNTPVGLPVPGTGEAITFGNQTAAGTYSVTGTKAAGGCTSNMLGSVTINPLVPVSVTINASVNPVNEGTVVTFTAVPINGGTLPAFQWSVNALAINGATNSTYAYAPANNDQVACIVTSDVECASGNPATSNTIVMAVNPTIPADLLVSGTTSITICYNATNIITVGGEVTPYTVTAPGGNATFIAGTSILFEPGTTVENGAYMLGSIYSGVWCGLKSASIVATSDQEDPALPVNAKTFYSVYPNPTSGSFTVEFQGEFSAGVKRVEVYGMHGGIVLSADLSGERKSILSLEGNPTGIYFIRIISADKSETVKIVKQ